MLVIPMYKITDKCIHCKEKCADTKYYCYWCLFLKEEPLGISSTNIKKKYGLTIAELDKNKSLYCYQHTYKGNPNCRTYLLKEIKEYAEEIYKDVPNTDKRKQKYLKMKNLEVKKMELEEKEKERKKEIMENIQSVMSKNENNNLITDEEIQLLIKYLYNHNTPIYELVSLVLEKINMIIEFVKTIKKHISEFEEEWTKLMTDPIIRNRK